MMTPRCIEPQCSSDAAVHSVFCPEHGQNFRRQVLTSAEQPTVREIDKPAPSSVSITPVAQQSGPAEPVTDTGTVRQFNTGATRDTAQDKLQYEGFLSPLVVRRYAEFMHKHRHQRDGSIRAADNWQKGIPPAVYMDSGFRHFMDWWGEHRGWWKSVEGIEEVLCALMFNVMGYLHERLAARGAYREDQR